MEFPILVQAPDSYKNLLPKGSRQEVLMSAEYLLDGKAYRVVGTVKKSLFGKIKDYNFLDFVVVDERGTVLKDKALSKRVYFCFSTLSMMFVSQRHIHTSVLDNPSYLHTAISRYEELIERVKPVVRLAKSPEEVYLESFRNFYDFLVESHKTNIDAAEIAPQLKDTLTKAIKHEPMKLETIEEYKILLQKFVQITHLRTLLVLKNDETFRIIKSILDVSRVRKEIDLEDLSEEVQLIRDILKGSREAITKSMIDSGVDFGAKTVQDVINHIVPIMERGRMIDELSEKQFSGQWFYRKEVS